MGDVRLPVDPAALGCGRVRGQHPRRENRQQQHQDDRGGQRQPAPPVDGRREVTNGSKHVPDTVSAGSARAAATRTCDDARVMSDLDSTAALVTDWYEQAARDLPWRRPGVSAWAVLVSEVMLQQTPVSRVLPAWTAWLAALAHACLAGGGVGRRRRAHVGQARLPAPRAAPARVRAGDRRAARRRGAGRRRRARAAARHRQPTPREPWRCSPTAAGIRSSTSTCGAWSRGRSSARARRRRRHRAATMPTVEALLPDDARCCGAGERGVHGTRRARVHGARAALRRVPARVAVRLAAGRRAGLHRPVRATATLRRHRPPGARTVAGRAARGQPRRSPRPRSTWCGPTRRNASARSTRWSSTGSSIRSRTDGSRFPGDC